MGNKLYLALLVSLKQLRQPPNNAKPHQSARQHVTEVMGGNHDTAEADKRGEGESRYARARIKQAESIGGGEDVRRVTRRERVPVSFIDEMLHGIDLVLIKQLGPRTSDKEFDDIVHDPRCADADKKSQ